MRADRLHGLGFACRARRAECCPKGNPEGTSGRSTRSRVPSSRSAGSNRSKTLNVFFCVRFGHSVKNLSTEGRKNGLHQGGFARC
jgi:hypothetical protein